MAGVGGASGDRHDTGFMPVPVTVLGAVIVFLSALLGGTAILAIGLAGGA